jgi:SecD/SecF fusion protein
VNDYFDRIERQLVGRVEAGVPRGSRLRLRLGVVAPALSVVVVVAIVVVFLGVHRASSPGSHARGGIELVYQAEPTPQTPAVTRAALAHAIDVLRQRAEAFGMSGASVRMVGGNEIRVRLPGFTSQARADRALGTTARLEFYDWEANALAPNGKTVASQLHARDPAAVAISQGSGTAPPGDPGAGGMSLYDAITLASKQPAQVSSDNARLGSQYYLFGAPGSAACATAAEDQHETPSPRVHCVLSGPDDNRSDLLSTLPAGVTASQGQELAVPPGTVVLQAADTSAGKQTNPNNPNAQFYVLKDHVAPFGNEITNPQESTGQSGAPDVTFSFTSKGGSAFHKVTATIAHRGELLSGLGIPFNQHFAVALDSKLITVPQIDFKTYPDGISGDNGADITANFTTQSARDLATQLRLGALPLNLRLILAKQLSVHG